MRRAVLIHGPNSSWQPVRSVLDRGGAVLVHSAPRGWAVEGNATRDLLPGPETESYLRIRHPALRRQFVASRRLVKHAAGAVLGVEPYELEVARSPGGKPYLRGYEELAVSIAHTDGLLVAALGLRGPVGADAERSDRRLDGTPLGVSFCTPAELAAVGRLPASERNAALTGLWTLKEAYTKALGVGMRLPFSSFGFAPGTGGHRLLDADGRPVPGDGWSFDTYRLPGGHVVSMAECRAAAGSQTA